MKSENINLLKEILKFLNEVPNKKYGNNYSLASRLNEMIREYEDASAKIEKDVYSISNCISVIEDNLPTKINQKVWE